MPSLITTLGPHSADMLGMILPHEHVFVDLRPDHPSNFAQADPAAVIAQMGPEIERAAHAGITALVECTPVGVGRRADILKAVSEATRFPIVVPTGIYREPWVPAWAINASEDDLYGWMLGELTDQIRHTFQHGDAETGVQAAWIKLSAGDDGITPVEAKILRAAARAGLDTGAIIGSHTIRGRVVHDQLDIIEAAGYRADRYIWIHAQSDSYHLNVDIAKRGAWIEYDGIGNPDWVRDEDYVERILRLLDIGYGDKILLSHDRGWYDPGQPGGGVPKPFTYLVETFLPQLRAAGVDEAAIRQMTQTNPFNAFAR